MRNPELNAAARLVRAAFGTSPNHFHPCPPGSWTPGTSTALTRFGSIHTTPLTRLVWTGSGLRNAAYMEGTPFTAGPAGLHLPSCGSGCLANGTMFGGFGRWGTVGASGEMRRTDG